MEFPMSEEDKKEFKDQAAENRKIYYEKKKAYDLSLSKDHPPLELSDEEEIIAAAAPDPTVTFEHIEELDFIIKCNKSITPNKKKKLYYIYIMGRCYYHHVMVKVGPFKEMIKNNFNFGSNWTGSEEYDIKKKTRRLIKNPEPGTWHIKKENCVFSIDEMNYVLSNFVNTKIIEKNENYYK